MSSETVRDFRQTGLKALMLLSALITCSVLVFMTGYVLGQGVKGLSIDFLTTKPSYLTGHIGILPDILNTVYILAAAIAVLLPLGTGAAVYLSEYAKNDKVVKLIDFAADILSGIPSIIYGLVGMLFFCRFLRMETSLLAGAGNHESSDSDENHKGKPFVCGKRLKRGSIRAWSVKMESRENHCDTGVPGWYHNRQYPLGRKNIGRIGSASVYGWICSYPAWLF